MSDSTIWRIEMIPWYAFAIAWLTAAVRSKPNKVTEPIAARGLLAVYTAVAFALLFSHWVPGQFLYRRFAPATDGMMVTGVVLTFLGAALAIWARITLGSNWSAHVNLKLDHQLVRSGAYARVRHPIYSGILLSMFGTALVVGEWRGLAAVSLFLAVHGVKARREEQFMLAEFGDQYVDYCRETGFLLPKR